MGGPNVLLLSQTKNIHTQYLYQTNEYNMCLLYICLWLNHSLKKLSMETL